MNKRRLSFGWGLAVALSLVTGPFLHAQESRGTILGRVTDESNAVIPGVAVEAFNIETGVTVSASTNAQGNYQIPLLNPGTYRVSFSITGFNKLVRDGLALRVADLLTVNASMQVGGLTEEVVVRAETATLDSASASLGQVVDLKRIEELPMREGNPMELTVLAPGIANTTDLRFRKSGMTHSQSQFDSDGTGEKRSDYAIDGIPNSSSFGGNQGVTVAYAPPAVSVQEFRVQTATYDASMGNTPGAVVNVMTKAGTSGFHGDVQYKFRSSQLDGESIFDQRAGFPKKDYSDHLYAAALGGPIRQNKTFFFVAFEGNNYGVPRSQGALTVPTEKMRNGDFSDLLKLGPQYQIYDPATIRPDPTNPGRFIRSPLPGNIIPANRLDPVAKKIVSYWGLPNVSGTADGRDNFQVPNFVEEQTNYTVTSRFDHNFSDKHRAYARLSWSWWANIKDDFYGTEADGFAEKRRNKLFAVDDIYMFSSSVVLNTRVGYTWQAFPQGAEDFGVDLGALGFVPSVVALYPKEDATFPQVGVGPSYLMRASSSVEGLGGVNGLMDYWTDIWSASSTLTWLKGSHSLRMGPEFRVYTESNLVSQFAPTLDFGTTWTRGPFDNSTAAPYGQEMASFLMGYLTGGSSRLNPPRDEKIWRLGLFVQDDWKVSPKLTVNLGIRYEYEEPLTESSDAMVNGFDFTTSQSIEPTAKANYLKNSAKDMPAGLDYKVRGGILYAGENGRSRLLHKRIWTNIAPRIGFAYEMNRKTVIRGGYGLFYDSPSYARYNVYQPGFSRSTPIVPSQNNGQTFLATIANPFPNNLLQPVGTAEGLLTNDGTSVSYPFVDDVKAPYGHRFSFGFQRELPWDFVLDFSYVGTRMRRLPVTTELNAVPAQYLSTLPTRDQATINYLTFQVANPLYQIPQVTAGMTGQRVNREQLLRPYPQFTSITTQESTGTRSYDAAQMRLERRFRNGFTFQASYTYSHQMEKVSYLNATDTELENVISGADRPHIFVTSGIFELPFGKGRRYGSDWSGFTEHVLGGWQVGVFYRIQSGNPIGFGNFLFKPGYSIKDVPKPADQRTQEALFAGLPSNSGTTNPWFYTEPFERTTANQLDRNIRTQPTRFSEVRAPGYALLDASLIKKLRFGRTELQLRFEGYNLLNKMNWRAPNTTATASTFGTISAISGYPRQFQLAAMFKF
jgi:hypothetical protein